MSKKKIFYTLGQSVASIDDLQTMNNFKDFKDKTSFINKKIKYTIDVDRNYATRHSLTIGATGSGKTTLLLGVCKQLMENGHGIMFVDGKNDVTVLQNYKNLAILTGREDDFYILNFGLPDDSHKLNPLMVGEVDDILEMLSNMLSTGGDNNYWGERGQALLAGALSMLVPLRNQNNIKMPDGEKKSTLTFGVLISYLSLRNFYDKYFEIKKRNEDVCKRDIKHPLYVNLDRARNYLESLTLDTNNKKDNEIENAAEQHGYAYSQWAKSFDLLMGTYGPIFDSDNPEIDIFDVVSNNRIVYVALPALKKSPTTLKNLGSLVLSIVKIALTGLLGDVITGNLLERKKSEVARPRQTFFLFLDELGSYMTSGFSDVLAQARSLGMSCNLLVQELASLFKADENEAKRLLGNTALKTFLKIDDSDTEEKIMKFVGEERVKIQSKSTDKEKDFSNRFEKEAIIDSIMLKKLQPGNCIVNLNGYTTFAVPAYYEPPSVDVYASFEEEHNRFYSKDKFESLISNYIGTKELGFSFEDFLGTKSKEIYLKQSYNLPNLKSLDSFEENATNFIKTIGLKEILSELDEVILTLEKIV